MDSYLGLTGNKEDNDALAKSYGYADAEAYKKAFNDALNVEWITPEGFENFSDQLTLGATNNIQENMNNLGGAYADMMIEAMSGINWNELTPEEAIAATEALTNVDMSAWDAAD